MIPNINPRGNVHFSSEEELCIFLRKTILPKICSNITKNFEFEPSCIIDYIGKNEEKTVLIEVKNWFVTIEDMMQIMKYLVHATEKYGKQNFEFYVIAGGIEEERQKILEKIGLKILLTRDLYDYTTST